jgi:hypothetical protein
VFRRLAPAIDGFPVPDVAKLTADGCPCGLSLGSPW